ncbi:MAG TPA: SDR family oxidoreductase [Candidatus Limnocylindria bacterium]|nr:SDR family oxidoreductase [Candidatus Limnocylindria bacterium]
MPVALVTGASRGIGAATALALAERGHDLAVNFREKAKRAEAVADEVRALGRRALALAADLTDAEAVRRMFETARRELGRLDVLVLNASGGMERDQGPDYAMRLNRDAQVAAVDAALPSLAERARVVFVTSHLAHFHGRREGYPAYEPVATSKRAGEDALRARIPALAARGVSLVVVSGDLIEGTITPRLMEREAPGLIEARRAQAGDLPTVERFAAAIADAATDLALVSGATVHVGSTEWSLGRGAQRSASGPGSSAG